MHPERSTHSERDTYYRNYDNDSLYVALRKALRSLSVLFLLCFCTLLAILHSLSSLDATFFYV